MLRTMWLTKWLPTRIAPKRSLRRLGTALALAGGVGGLSACGSTWPKPGTPAAAAEWPAALVGSWAAVGRTARGSAVPDTVLWVLRPAGLLEHREVQVRPRGDTLAARERAVMTARWWTKARGTGDASIPVVCTSQRPGRSSQCGQVRVDTVTDARGRARHRLTWTGVTFRKQRWTFVER